MKRTILLSLLCATGALAQGTFLVSWHGYSNEFQASLEIPAFPYEPGSTWGTNITDVMAETVSVLDPMGNSYSAANAAIRVGGGINRSGYWYFSMFLDNFDTGWEVVLGGTGGSLNDMTTESNMFSNQRNFEHGFWTQEWVGPGAWFRNADGRRVNGCGWLASN